MVLFSIIIILFYFPLIKRTCGTTIGPILSANLGITTVDVGAPQFAMHSIRETGSTLSITQYIELFKAFFRNYGKLRELYSNIM